MKLTVTKKLYFYIEKIQKSIYLEEKRCSFLLSMSIQFLPEVAFEDDDEDGR